MMTTMMAKGEIVEWILQQSLAAVASPWLVIGLPLPAVQDSPRLYQMDQIPDLAILSINYNIPFNASFSNLIKSTEDGAR
jgi:hypothetical protein